MNKSKVLVGFVILLSLLFMVFRYNEYYLLADISRYFVAPFITLLYLINKKEKSTYFTLFLVAFSISELSAIVSFIIPYDLEYYIGNMLYITAYMSLAYGIISSIDIKHLFTHFKVHIFVLFIFNIYANYILLMIQKEYINAFNIDFGIELIYNAFIIILLSVSLLNYFYRDDKKALILFLGSLCIVFSEVIQTAYYYISDKDLLNVSYSLLLILAFYFYYVQSKLEHEEVLVIA